MRTNITMTTKMMIMTAMTMTRKYILFTELTTRPIQSSRPDVCVCMVRCMLSPRH